jgi:hypothetical protein
VSTAPTPGLDGNFLRCRLPFLSTFTNPTAQVRPELGRMTSYSEVTVLTRRLHSNSQSIGKMSDRLGDPLVWEDNRYFWVVLCKYRWFHVRDSRSIFFRYRIALGETDAIAPCPVVDSSFMARCDKCGKEASYRASDLFRFELDDPPDPFTPHPLVRQGGTQSVVMEQSPASISAKARPGLPPVRRSV